MYGNMGDSFKYLFLTLIGLVVVFVPLGAWKAFELIRELVSHIHWK